MKIAFAPVLFLAAIVYAQQSASVWDGVYMQEQAGRGKALYDKNCASCHGKALDGISAPALTGMEFMGSWDGLTADDLFERIQTAMPADDPGRLSRTQTADLVAFLLTFNGFPAGQKELPNDAASLKTIRFEAVRPK
jgi:mono/diheme cytochrome c family protein